MVRRVIQPRDELVITLLIYAEVKHTRKYQPRLLIVSGRVAGKEGEQAQECKETNNSYRRT